MKIKKIPMKKNTLVIIIAVVVFGLFAVYYVNNMKKKDNVIYYETASNNDLTEAQAKVIIDEKVKAIMNLYEKPLETFDVEKSESNMSFDNIINGKELSELDYYYYKVTNYTDIVKELYTENGVKELESTKFGDKTFIKREDNSVYVLKTLPASNKYLGGNIAYYGIKFNNQVIVGGIRITKYDMVDDVINYYIVDKTIKIVKIEDKWYVESFVYSDN